MDLHYEPVLKAHACHLRQHLRPKKFLLFVAWIIAEHGVKHTLGIAFTEVGSLRSRVPMVRCSSSKRFEESAPRCQRPQITAPGRRVFSRQNAKRLNTISKTRKTRIHDRVGPKCRKDPSFPARIEDRPVFAQGIKRLVTVPVAEA